MKKMQKIGILGLCFFYFIIFGSIGVFMIFWMCKFFCALGEGCGTAAWIVGVAVMVYLLFFTMAMQWR